MRPEGRTTVRPALHASRGARYTALRRKVSKPTYMPRVLTAAARQFRNALTRGALSFNIRFSQNTQRRARLDTPSFAPILKPFDRYVFLLETAFFSLFMGETARIRLLPCPAGARCKQPLMGRDDGFEAVHRAAAPPHKKKRDSLPPTQPPSRPQAKKGFQRG